MAIVLRGKSVCHLCGRVLGTDEDVQLFPAGLFRAGSAAAHLNDSAVHVGCFKALGEYGEAATVLDAYVRLTTSGSSERGTEADRRDIDIVMGRQTD